MTDKVKPDGMMWPDEDTGAEDDREPVYRHSTILRVIDENVERLRGDGELIRTARVALACLRARFEEVEPK